MTSSSNSRESIFRPLGIQPDGSLTNKRLPGSFFDTIMRALRRRRIPEHLLAQGRNPSEQYQEYARELFMLWYYRLKLLKQLEQQLVFYHGQDESYRFLH